MDYDAMWGTIIIKTLSLSEKNKNKEQQRMNLQQNHILKETNVHPKNKCKCILTIYYFFILKFQYKYVIQIFFWTT